MHSHFLPKTWPCLTTRHGGEGWPSMRHCGPLPTGTFGYDRTCSAMLMSGGADFRPVTNACWDVRARLDDLDRFGVHSQIISATPILFQWDRPREASLDVARHFNDAALEMCSVSHGRLHALCQVPLNHVDDACLELERSMANGHVGVHIGNHIGAKDLDDEGIITFLQHAAALNAAVLVHPWDMDPFSGRLARHMMGWTVGMPMETHLSIVAMVRCLPPASPLARPYHRLHPTTPLTSLQILGGAFDRLPESLRICFAHGGGAFPYLLGRLENAWHQRSIARGCSMHPPSHYLDRFSVDSAVFDERALRLLVETMGPHRVMLGSDYPFPLGEQDIGALVRGCGQLSDLERRMILGGNAANFFGVPLMQQYAAPRREVPPPPLRAQQAAGYWLVGASSGARFASPPPAFALQYSYRPPGAQQLSARPLSSAHGPRPSATRGRRGLSTQPAAISPADAEESLYHVSSYVDGMLCDAAGGASLPLIDQASGKPRGTVPSSSAADVADAIAAASRAFQRGEWVAASTVERARVLWRAAALLEAESDTFAAAESRDTGKPVRLAAAVDVPRAVANLRFFAGLVEHGAGGELRHGGGADRSSMDDALNYTVRKPVGVVGLVTPWNLPLYLLTWKLAPALAMGNAVVAKPSELAPTTATMLAVLLERAGLPPGIFNVVHGTGQEAGAALCSHQSVGALSFTGGTQTGAAVAAAVAPRFAKLSLELGGKNAMLVFADCDVDLAVDAAVRASFLNAGQICLCASRILVQDSADGFYERFAAAFAAKAAALTVGHPDDASTDVGPLVSASHRDKARAHACATLPLAHRSSCLTAP